MTQKLNRNERERCPMPILEITNQAEYETAARDLHRLIAAPEGSPAEQRGATLLSAIEQWEKKTLGEPLKRVFSEDGDSFVTVVPRRPWA